MSRDKTHAGQEAEPKLETLFLSAQQRKSRRLMVVLHGLGDSTAGYVWLPSALGFEWMNYLLVNAPDPYYGGYSWFDFAGHAAPGVKRSRQLLWALLDQWREGGFPSDQTVLFGFSQGGLMTLDVGLRYPHRFAGLASISGCLFEPERLVAESSAVAREQRLLVTHGTLDPIIPFATVRQQVNTLKTAGFPLQWHELTKAHTIAGEEELTLIRDFVAAGYGGVRHTDCH